MRVVADLDELSAKRGIDVKGRPLDRDGREPPVDGAPDGVEEERTEEPYATFNTTSGEVFGSITLWPYMQAGFVAPEEPGTEGQWIVVLRDRRGGMGWWVQDWIAL